MLFVYANHMMHIMHAPVGTVQDACSPFEARAAHQSIEVMLVQNVYTIHLRPESAISVGDRKLRNAPGLWAS